MVEQMTQRWHGESCRETCLETLRCRSEQADWGLGIWVPSISEPHGLFPHQAAPQCVAAARSRTVCPHPPHSFYQDQSTAPSRCLPSGATQAGTPLLMLSEQYLWYSVSVYHRWATCLLSWKSTFLPFGFPSAMVSNEKPLGQPQMPASLNPPSSSSLLHYLPHTGVSKYLRNHFSLFLHVHQEEGESTKPWKCHHLDTFQPTSSRGQSEFDPDQKISPKLLKYTYSNSSRGVERPY